jgi:hypothetical protein
MTGPQHYRKAEYLLVSARALTVHHEQRQVMREEAQVHATLALAAASALSISPQGDPTRDEWLEALS